MTARDQAVDIATHAVKSMCRLEAVKAIDALISHRDVLVRLAIDQGALQPVALDADCEPYNPADNTRFSITVLDDLYRVVDQ